MKRKELVSIKNWQILCLHTGDQTNTFFHQRQYLAELKETVILAYMSVDKDGESLLEIKAQETIALTTLFANLLIFS